VGGRGGGILTCVARAVGVGAAAGGAARAQEPEAADFCSEQARRQKPGGAVVSKPMAFRMLSSVASGGWGGRCPCAKPRIFCRASVLPWTSSCHQHRSFRLGFETLFFRNAWYSDCEASKPPRPKGITAQFTGSPEILPSIAPTAGRLTSCFLCRKNPTTDKESMACRSESYAAQNLLFKYIFPLNNCWMICWRKQSEKISQ
jgi:hypothetical protein